MATTNATTVAPFVLKDVSLTLGTTATNVEYKCQLQRAELVPAAGGGGGNTYETFCDTFSSGSTSTTWTLELSGFQAFADANDLALYLFDHEGEEADFLLAPVKSTGSPISSTNPAFGGKVTLQPTSIGGTANQYAQFTVSLPCTAKPIKVTTPPASQAEEQLELELA